MKQPNEYWLKYLLTFSGSTRAQIASMAEMYAMVPPTQEYLSALDQKLSNTKPNPFRLSSPNVLSWIRRQRMMSLYREDEHATEARDILGDNKKRKIIEALTLAEAESETIAHYLSLLCNTTVSERVINIYQHYFWNPKIMTTKQWFKFLNTHPDGKILKDCLGRDPEYALWKIGHRIELSQEDVLKEVLHESSMRFMELCGRPNNRNTALTAKLWAENLFKAHEELSRTGDAAKEVLEELRGISIKLGKRDISSIEDLTKDDK